MPKSQGDDELIADVCARVEPHLGAALLVETSRVPAEARRARTAVA